MIKWTAVLLIIAVVAMQSVYSKKIPSFLTACKRKDPNLGKCLKTFIETIMKRSANGIPELNIPPVEPFVIPQIVLDQGGSTAVKMTATFNNLAVHGASKVILTGVKANTEQEPRIEIQGRIPTVRILSDYKIDGKVLVVPIKGAGKCQMNLTEVTGVFKIRPKVVERKGKKYLDIGKPALEVNLKNAHFYFANLFNGNKELGETTNAFINENWPLLLKEMRPVIQNSIETIVEYLGKLIFETYTYDEFLPEN